MVALRAISTCSVGIGKQPKSAQCSGIAAGAKPLRGHGLAFTIAAFEIQEKDFMGNRLSKISTRTGDDGSTGLGDGTRTSKNALRVAAMGDVDELNSHIGVLLTEPLPEELRVQLGLIQHDLFDLGGELSIPGHAMLAAHRVAALDELLQTLNSRLTPLKEFILPGGTRGAAFAHIARTVCRRAERTLVALRAQEEVSEEALRYLNRLSDLMFVIARILNLGSGQGDVLWKR
jgi:cob(I)alamin adenosyltransferase